MKHLFVFEKIRLLGAVSALAGLAALGPMTVLAQSADLSSAAPAAASEQAPADPSAVGDGSASTDDPITRLIRSGDTVDLDSLKWTHRPIVVFADSPADPQYKEQIDRLSAGASALLERDVIVLTDTDPGTRSALRKKLRPRGFMLVLLGKDGGVKLRKPRPWTVRELSRTIDKFPSRLREVEERRGS